MVGLPGAFRQLYRKYGTVQQQWSPGYRRLFLWAWRRKRLAIRRTCQSNDGLLGGLLDWALSKLIPRIDSFLGGRLRHIIVCDRDMPVDVLDFLEVPGSGRDLSAPRL